MPPKNPWQHDVVHLNNKGLDVIHPVEQVDAEHYSRMNNVKSLQEGTITPRPGTSLVAASAVSAPSQPVQEGQAVRVYGNGTSSPNHSFNAPNYGFTQDLVYFLAIFQETGSTPATPSSIVAGGATWVEVGHIDFGTIASPASSIWVFRTKAPSTISSGISWVTDIATPTFASIHEFIGMDTGGSNGADAVVQVSTTAADAAAGTSLTTTLSAFGQSANGTFAVGQCNDGNRSYTATAPMVEIYDAGTGGTLHFTAMFYDGNDLTPETVLDTARDNAILAIEIKAA